MISTSLSSLSHLSALSAMPGHHPNDNRLPPVPLTLPVQLMNPQTKVSQDVDLSVPFDSSDSPVKSALKTLGYLGYMKIGDIIGFAQDLTEALKGNLGKKPKTTSFKYRDTDVWVMVIVG